MRQLALIISLLILGVEGLLLYFSIENKKEELLHIKKDLSQQVYQETGKSLKEIYPSFLNNEDLKKRMLTYKKNILFLTLLITLIVSLGTMMIFYKKAGRHLVYLNKVNLEKAKTKGKSPRYHPSEIPHNEIGALILSREEMLDQIEAYEEDLQKKLKEAETRLVQSAKLSLVGEFTAGLIHDIKNPLTVIISYTQMLLKREKRAQMNEEKIEERLEKIKIAADKLHRLVDRMGRFNRHEEDFQKEIDLLKVLENSLLFTESKGKKIGVTGSRFYPDEAKVFGDEASLEQVFSNLFSNAFDAMENEQTRHLTLTIEDHGESFAVHVKDTGKGIDYKQQELIFDSFFTT
jgi:signal transduction histidine kinase